MSKTGGSENNGEPLEVVGENGQVSGLATRGQCHGDPTLAHRAVHVLVRNSRGDLFLQKRASTKCVQPGKWDSSVGGHLLPGESYEAAAKRELEEELGITASRPPKAGGIEYLHDYVWRSEIETEHVRTFRVVSDGPFRLHPDEIAEGRFWSERELRETAGSGVFTPNLEEELRRAGILKSPR